MRQSEEKLNTQDETYTRRLLSKESSWWKKLFDVQRPYRWNLNSLKPGFTLDLGCGLGRNLLNLSPGSGVGVDNNPSSIEVARGRGLEAFMPDAFESSLYAKLESFDTLLMSHLIEHLTEDVTLQLLGQYLRYIKRDGKIIVIVPQELGYASDATHVRFVDKKEIQSLFEKCGLQLEKYYSFPFPRPTGKIFKYNESVFIGRFK